MAFSHLDARASIFVHQTGTLVLPLDPTAPTMEVAIVQALMGAVASLSPADLNRVSADCRQAMRDLPLSDQARASAEGFLRVVDQFLEITESAQLLRDTYSS